MRAERVKSARQARRVRRVRKKVSGGPQRPRLTVARSHRNIHAQIIDDTAGRVLCAASSQAKELRAQIGYGGNQQAATIVGKALGEQARSQGIEQVCFDRRGRKYHGRVKALADAAREAGLKF
jgi:large subunit ribosomal protein L18